MRRIMDKLVLLALAVGLVVSVAAPAVASSTTERVAVTTMDEEATVTGTSTLRRADRGIHAVVRTSALVPGDAYTVWAIVFNNPSACDGPCNAADLTNPAVGGVSTLGTGKVVKSERTRFTIRMATGAELTTPHGAEIHFVIRTHGTALPNLVSEQISSLHGGCPPNTCANVLVAKHV